MHMTYSMTVRRSINLGLFLIRLWAVLKPTTCNSSIGRPEQQQGHVIELMIYAHDVLQNAHRRPQSFNCMSAHPSQKPVPPQCLPYGIDTFHALTNTFIVHCPFLPRDMSSHGCALFEDMKIIDCRMPTLSTSKTSQQMSPWGIETKK